MVHEVVEGSGLRTQYSGGPTVTVETLPDGPTTVRLEFSSEAAYKGSRIRVTRLTFTHVLEYRWVVDGLVYALSNPLDYKSRLIKVLDSDHVKMMMEKTVRRTPSPWKSGGGGIRESDVRHYRIGFSDHGMYDIICLGLEIDYTSTTI